MAILGIKGSNNLNAHLRIFLVEVLFSVKTRKTAMCRTLIDLAAISNTIG